MSAKKLVVSTYLQYILIAIGALLLFTFVRQIGGVLLTFLLAAVLAYVLNPLVRRLEAWRIPRVVAVLGVFVALVAAVLVALLLLIIPAVSQVQALIQNPEVLTDGVARLSDWTRELPYVGERIEAVDQTAITQFVQSNAPSAGQVFNGALGFIGGVFGVFGTILNLLLMLIVSIYLLLDRERISAAALRTVPATIRDQSVELFHAVEGTLVKYLKAQLLLCAIMGAIGWAIAYFTFGSYALLIGLWVGVTEIIPVLGAFLGAVPAVLIALFSGGLDAGILVALLFFWPSSSRGTFWCRGSWVAPWECILYGSSLPPWRRPHSTESSAPSSPYPSSRSSPPSCATCVGHFSSSAGRRLPSWRSLPKGTRRSRPPAPPAKSPRAFGAPPGERGRAPWGCRMGSRAGLSPTKRLFGG